MAWSSVSSVMGRWPLNLLSRDVPSEAGLADLSCLSALALGAAIVNRATSRAAIVTARNVAPHASRCLLDLRAAHPGFLAFTIAVLSVTPGRGKSCAGVLGVTQRSGD